MLQVSTSGLALMIVSYTCKWLKHNGSPIKLEASSLHTFTIVKKVIILHMPIHIHYVYAEGYNTIIYGSI